MKNLILVTKVGNYFELSDDNYGNEFSLYNNNVDECYIHKIADDINFIIVNGGVLINLKGPNKANKLIEIINSINGDIENLIAYHDELWSEDIKEVLNEQLKILKIKKYSTASDESNSPVYQNYLIELRALIKGNGNNTERRDELINGLYNFFLGDPLLEAKLNLLLKCLDEDYIKILDEDKTFITSLIKNSEKTKIESAFDNYKDNFDYKTFILNLFEDKDEKSTIDSVLNKYQENSYNKTFILNLFEDEGKKSKIKSALDNYQYNKLTELRNILLPD